MFSITSHTAELINDDFGILSGDRYEFFLHIEVDEDDELYSEKGIVLRAILLVENNTYSIVKYDFIENETDQHLDFELEEDEKEYILDFCKNHLPDEIY